MNIVNNTTAATARLNLNIHSDTAIDIHIGVGIDFNATTFTHSLPQLYSALNARKSGRTANTEKLSQSMQQTYRYYTKQHRLLVFGFTLRDWAVWSHTIFFYGASWFWAELFARRNLFWVENHHPSPWKKVGSLLKNYLNAFHGNIWLLPRTMLAMEK